ncbi:hypothetical protein L9F63_017448 [Diploptera punctata]|uniref:Transposase n=1 Tax=Diploptera punctata TaxID=6984 RepID=A0AAD8A0Q9_DIPPU|nr:hypothetical protein L9F63_017448 [Diploptera punctata]
MNTFRRTGSVLDEKRSADHRPLQMKLNVFSTRLNAVQPQTSANEVERIQHAIERSPDASTRRLSNELDIPRTTVWRVFRFKLNKRSYHLQVLHHLEQKDYAACQAMCHDLLQAVANENRMNNIIFSDEATFQPDAACEWQRDTPKINVWLGVTATKLYGPFMFQEPTVTGLMQDGVLHSVIFQQDGAPPHFALCVRAYNNATFPGCWISRAAPRMGASRSPDVTPLDFFLRGVSSSPMCTRLRFVIFLIYGNAFSRQ